MRAFNLTFTGVQPLLMHNDDIEWADRMDDWKSNKDNKAKSKAGDDRTPAFRWIGALYHDGENIVIPTANIMRAAMEGGAMVPVPGAKGNKTFKAQSQSGIMPQDLAWPLLVNGKPVPFAPLAELMNEGDFAKHKARATELGFSLFVKRVKIGMSKHIRVRPRFEQWSVAGQLLVVDDQITERVFKDIFESAGRHKGLCDWRPSSKTPGTFGMFQAQIAAA